jgi:hypothetical protein
MRSIAKAAVFVRAFLGEKPEDDEPRTAQRGWLEMIGADRPQPDRSLTLDGEKIELRQMQPLRTEDWV